METYSIEIRQGDGYRLGLQVGQEGADFTGATFEASVARPGRPETRVSFAVTELEDLDPGPGKTFRLVLTPAQTRGLDHRREWIWDLQMTLEGADPLTLVGGAVEVLPEVTA